MRRVLTILLLSFVVVLSGCYSCASYHDAKGTGPVDPSVAHKMFWSRDCKPIDHTPDPVVVAPRPRPKPAPKPEPKPAPKPVVAESDCGPYAATNSYGGGVIRLDKVMPKQVQLNVPFEYNIKVTNLTNTTVNSVAVTENLSKNFKLVSAAPEGRVGSGSITWSFNTIDANSSKVIEVTGIATSTDCLEHCAIVEYKVPTCTFVTVVEPKLVLTKSAPSVVTICQEIPIKFTVVNNGTGMATGVKVEDKLPAGLVTLTGLDSISVDVGDLKAGEAKAFTVKTKANKTGTFTNKATATANAGLRAASGETKTVVTQPVLTIKKTGPANLYIGRSATYTIVVTNTGDASAANTVITDTIPRDVIDVKASASGNVEGSKVTWQAGSLAPKASKTVTVTYTPTKAGEISNKADAKAVCAQAVSAMAKTAVKGIAALLLEVIDVSDPIEVGSNETYKIVVTNQGTSTATNVMIESMLEGSMQFISASGATAGSHASGTVTFKPLGTLAPKAKATWTVVVKAVKEGDVRFSVKMNSDQLDRDVDETESTKFYK